jgi:hypothetical protein
MTIDQLIEQLQRLRLERGDLEVVLQSSDPENHYAVTGCGIGHYIGYQLYTTVVFIEHMAHIDEVP